MMERDERRDLDCRETSTGDDINKQILQWLFKDEEQNAEIDKKGVNYREIFDKTQKTTDCFRQKELVINGYTIGRLG